MNKDRIVYIDISRAIAILFIVLAHTLVHSAHCTLISKFICSFNVMMFFMLSGFLASVKKTNFVDYAKKKFIRILIPYFIWALIFLIPYLFVGKSVGDSLSVNSSFDIFELLKNIVIGNGNNNALKQNSSFWFLPALFSMSIIYYPIIKYSEKNKKIQNIILLFLVIIGFTKVYCINYVFPFGINTVLELGIFYYIGYLLKSNKTLDKRATNSILTLLLLLIIGLVVCFTNSVRVAAIGYQYGSYGLVLISGTTLSLFFILLCKKIVSCNLFSYIGKNTFGILIFHKIVIIIFQTKLGKISNLLLNSNFFVEIILSLVIVGISVSFSLFLTKIVRYIYPPLLGEKYNHNGIINNIKNKQKIFAN